MKAQMVVLLWLAAIGCTAFSPEDRPSEPTESASGPRSAIEEELEDWDSQQGPPADPRFANIRVDVEQVEVSRSEWTRIQAEIGYEGETARGRVRATIGGLPLDRNGLEVAILSKNLRARLLVSRESERSRSRTTQFLVVMSGQEASFFVGELIPALTVAIYGHGAVIRTEHVAGARASLLVRPQALPSGQIRVYVEPQIASSDRRTGVLQLTELATEVLVPDGATIAIGGTTQAEDTFGGQILGRSHSARDTKQLILLSARVLGSTAK